MAEVGGHRGHHLRLRHHRAAREDPGGEALAQDQEVRLDAGVLGGEEPPGAAAAGEHLVGDEQQAPLVGETAQAAQVVLRGSEAAGGGAEDRLHQERRRLAADAVESGLRFAGAGDFAAGEVEAEGASRAPGRRDEGRRQQQRFVRGPQPLPPGDGQRAQGVAVVPGGLRDDEAPLRVPEGEGVGASEFDRRLHGFRPAGGQIDLRVAVTRRQGVQQPRRRLLHRGGRELRTVDESRGLQLAGRGADDLRTAVAHGHREGAAAGVEEAVAVLGLHPDSFGARRFPVLPAEVPVEDGTLRVTQRVRPRSAPLPGPARGRNPPGHGAGTASERAAGRSVSDGRNRSGAVARNRDSPPKALGRAAVRVPAAFPIATSSGRSPR